MQQDFTCATDTICHNEIMLGEGPAYNGISESFLKDHTVNSRLGRSVRAADAGRLLEEMQKEEWEVRERERLAGECHDRIESMLAQHRLSAQYLVSFGVAAEHREELREILEEVSANGGLSLQDSINLANARADDLHLQSEG